jgi:hypothetical protein
MMVPVLSADREQHKKQEQVAKKHDQHHGFHWISSKQFHGLVILFGLHNLGKRIVAFV